MSTISATPRPAVAEARKIRAKDRDWLWRWLYVTPSFVVMLGLALLPILNLLVLSFGRIQWVDGLSQFSMVGLANYARLPSDPLFTAAVSNTLIFAAFAVLGQVVLGLALAYICTKVTKRRTLYRAIFLLPILLPGIVIGAIWKLMLNVDFGLFNQVITFFGGSPVPWLSSPSLALLSIIVVDIWHWTPFCFLIFLASLESLPKEVSEAAKVDGANGWQEFRSIALPMIAPSIIVVAVFRMIVAFKVFDEIYLLTAGGPGTATEVLSFSIYRKFFTEDNPGYGSAISIAAIFAICLLLSVAVVARRANERTA